MFYSCYNRYCSVTHESPAIQSSTCPSCDRQAWWFSGDSLVPLLLSGDLSNKYLVKATHLSKHDTGRCVTQTSFMSVWHMCEFDCSHGDKQHTQHSCAKEKNAVFGKRLLTWAARKQITYLLFEKWPGYLCNDIWEGFLNNSFYFNVLEGSPTFASILQSQMHKLECTPEFLMASCIDPVSLSYIPLEHPEEKQTTTFWRRIKIKALQNTLGFVY